MTIETGVERLAAMVLLLTCLSHATAPKAWAGLFARIGKADGPGLAIAAIHLPLGLALVAFHDVWRWPAAIFTIIGWALLLKGTAHLLFPGIGRLSLRIAGTGERAERRCRLVGITMTPLALLLCWLAFGLGAVNLDG